MKTVDIDNAVDALRLFFSKGETLSLDYRKDALTRLYNTIVEHEAEIVGALQKDFKKSSFETYTTEIGMVLEEIRYQRKHLARWARPKKVSSPLHQFPATSKVYRDPFGVVLVLAPWNYPFQLALAPVVGAIAAGNCVLLKASSVTTATSKILKKVIKKSLDPNHVATLHGDRATTTYALKKRFDYIFFTGSLRVGKIVMKAAAAHLTPVTLELGGKSPVIVESDANIAVAARRIAWGKFMNMGQTCVAPDYLYIHSSVKDQFVQEMKSVVEEFYGENVEKSKDYPRVITPAHYDRIKGYLKNGKILFGGKCNDKTSYIEPTLLGGVKPKSKVMKEEIFGPILPVIEFEDIDLVIKEINSGEKPLALYHFSESKERSEKIIAETYSGGVTLNDTIVHLTNPKLPFGGVGASGMGVYHGEYSFDTFSAKRAVMNRKTWLDLPFRYPPYTAKKLSFVKKLLK